LLVGWNSSFIKREGKAEGKRKEWMDGWMDGWREMAYVCA